MVYGIGFLVKQPNYDCLNSVSGLWESCKNDQICKHGLPSSSWRFNYQDTYSFPNFVEKLSLTCVPKSVIGMIGGAYFLGFGISAGIVPRLSDLYGRKVPLTIIQVIQQTCYLCIINSRNIYQLIFAYLTIGLCTGGRFSIVS